MTARTAPLTRRGPVVHVRLDGVWDERRGFLAVRPLRCHFCRNRIEAGTTVVRTPGDLGYAGGCCVAIHTRGSGACPLCDRARMSGPRCRRCNGSGYGEIER